ncbi:MAG: hypothetical protein AC479_02775 [miscellaneous Crenarchaeota group-6 archaeon AD8-1]|nr:MAG: hypothetical protein AC479_02775 [miscellaneous Crenarchaeota group-6 archaeon AD8-1]
MSTQILRACKELIEDAKKSCADLVFKEFCLDVLSKAGTVLNDTEFNQLVVFASELIEGKNLIEYHPQITVKS